MPGYIASLTPKQRKAFFAAKGKQHPQSRYERAVAARHGEDAAIRKQRRAERRALLGFDEDCAEIARACGVGYHAVEPGVFLYDVKRPAVVADRGGRRVGDIVADTHRYMADLAQAAPIPLEDDGALGVAILQRFAKAGIV